MAAANRTDAPGPEDDVVAGVKAVAQGIRYGTLEGTVVLDNGPAQWEPVSGHVSFDGFVIPFAFADSTGERLLDIAEYPVNPEDGPATDGTPQAEEGIDFVSGSGAEGEPYLGGDTPEPPAESAIPAMEARFAAQEQAFRVGGSYASGDATVTVTLSGTDRVVEERRNGLQVSEARYRENGDFEMWHDFDGDGRRDFFTSTWSTTSTMHTVRESDIDSDGLIDSIETIGNDAKSGIVTRTTTRYSEDPQTRERESFHEVEELPALTKATLTDGGACTGGWNGQRENFPALRVIVWVDLGPWRRDPVRSAGACT